MSKRSQLPKVDISSINAFKVDSDANACNGKPEMEAFYYHYMKQINMP